MWKYQLLLCCVSMYAGALAGYEITPSAPLAHYRYPAPRRQLTIPSGRISSGGGGGGVQHYQQRTNNYASYAQQQQQYRPQQQQYRPQQQLQQRQLTQQVSYSAAPLFYQQQQQQQQQQQPHAPVAGIAQQFAAPALDNAAFTTALTSQGYVIGGSAARSLPSAAGGAVNNNIVVDAPEASLNLRLPLPLNVVPIKVGALPLQAGASFDAIPHRINSYGTTYPQRKRR